MAEPAAPGANGAADVLIVGAGPVGLLTAILLGRAGLRVSVVERWPARYPLPRACTIDHEALRILQRAGVMADHADLFEPSRGPRGGYQIRNGDGALLRAINWNRTAESGWANTNGFYQPDLEAVLESMAASLPSVELHRGWTAQAVGQDAAGVTLRIARTAGDPEPRDLRAAWLVAADGANSIVREQVGIATDDSGFAADWLVVDYRPTEDRQWDAFVTQYCDPEQPATAVNSGPGRRRFEFMRRPDVSVEEITRPEAVWRLMSGWGVTPDNARLERQAVYTFRGRWATAWRRGRVLLAGDAAHLMPPFLGQGLCSGLRDAAALGWRLQMVVQGLTDEAVLDSYGPERLAHVRVIIDEAIALGQVICERDPARAAERDRRMTAELEDPASRPVEPPHPPLGSPSITVPGDPLAGHLSVQGRIRVDGRVGLFDDLVCDGWQLIGLDRDPTTGVDPALRRWFSSIGGAAVEVTADGPIADIDGTYRSWFAANGCEVVLARPDCYVYGTGNGEDAARLLTSLRSALGAPAAPARLLRSVQEGALP